MGTTPADLLSPLEAETMAVLWRAPRCRVEDATVLVNEARDRQLSERTVATILRRLDAKGYATHEVEGRAFRYTAVVPEEEFVAWHGRRAISALLRRYGTKVAIAGLLEEAKADTQTLKALEQVIEHRRKDAT
jgi:predicted transcriptional regulator